ncbi:SOS response-associated peptidase family protein [Aquimarina agarivorans]|uniref:SOS response-associated peptidase family protein n=1 Tax=Aquimarina agarivorans TaxID=980584 RepID=UPI000248EA37|nr:SOS response-associated peptidase family protein [Aquimarina agarivorans]
MKYKFSNTANKESLEDFVGLPLKYPKIYTTKPLISSFEENIMPVITSNSAEAIDYGIWGLLPENYLGDWGVFQSILDTLTVTPEFKKNNVFFKQSTSVKRCVILVTGFFVSHLHNGLIYPYYIFAKKNKPLYLAGYYNKLADGFITFSIALGTVDPRIKKIQNLSNFSPRVLSEYEKFVWLSEDSDTKVCNNLLENNTTIKLNFHSIAKDLYTMGISYSTMLEPVVYDNIPKK